MSSNNNSDQPTDQAETLLELPCEFPVKAMGRDEDDFKSLITGIILGHADIYKDIPVTSAPSSSGTYLSVTVTIEAQSKAQLDRIYQDLTDCERVLVAL